MTTLAHTYREALATILEHTDPDAPTLCEGWTCADLAAHLYVRENDPMGSPGIIIPPLAGLTRARMDKALASLGYLGVVDAFAHGPRSWSPMGIPGLDRMANGIEFFVHYEDVHRAQEGWSASELPGPGLSDELWQRLRLSAKFLARKSPVGLRLERTDVDPAESVAVRPGDQIVTITGTPGELVLWCYGRRAAVDFIGDPEPVEAVKRMARGF
ncbi:TIGR03085 family metal-binding protein [Propionibacterium sp.]|uniref:TIGR03085 family metal-binding protein n=1 Tax=Propionibacterium sp. TaxID=1977903 RepID=UPI0039E8F514